MKQIAHISFSLIFIFQALSPNMDMCCELKKLPTLFEHFEEHKAMGGDTFLEFVVEDYVHHDENSTGHHDHDKDDDLPFHGQHQCCHGPVFMTLFQYLPEIADFNFTTQIKLSAYSFSLCSEYSETPFQPPKA